MNYGARGDIAYANGRHNIKVGMQLMQTRLHEIFSIGITDPTFNAVCVNLAGEPQELPAVRIPSGCAGRGFLPNADFLPSLLPLDLTRGGSLFKFDQSDNVNEYAAYVQDSITIGKLTLNPGLRVDRYSAITKGTAVQPRVGLSYLIGSTVLRAGYARTFETPYNENLLLSSFAGPNGFTDVQQSSQQFEPGRGNQYNIGFQQALSRYLQIDADYFWKFMTRIRFRCHPEYATHVSHKLAGIEA